MTLIDAIPYALSAVTIYMNVLAGNKHPRAWAVGLLGQVGWSGWIVSSGTWGFLPMNLALWWVYGRNHWKWSRR